MIYLQQQVKFIPRYNLYTMNIDQEKNCYNYRGFGYLVRNCRNRKIIEQGKRFEYEDNQNNLSNLNGEENLIVLNQILIIIGL